MPSTPPMFLGGWIARLYRAGQQAMAISLHGTGIGAGQFPFLRLLARQDGLCQDTIAHALYLDKGTVARALQKLESQNFVRRRADAADARKLLVFLTPKGRRAAVLIHRALAAWHRVLLGGLEADEQRALRRSLEKMHANAEAWLAAPPPVRSSRSSRSRERKA
ncbi:MAG: Transcriptional regulator, MarR family [Candidatus Ozemobacter sibiricus]|uniref:Transcriptional regulator, MarR family n=1 Tax=Candidatus Ozemobacter sibiricus TaxID=2268124 RepID=A0A367ZTG7_9BACT|nr:MAG: Transcriptional regulator, MarR family [Candidatus Ozemobacter sibiricus]